jgi:hypothetical protein
VVDQGISAFIVTERAIEPIRFGLEDENLVPFGIEPEATGQSQLERHVETRRRAHSAEVVNRHRTGGEEVVNPLQPPLPCFPHFDHTAGLLAKRDQVPTRVTNNGSYPRSKGTLMKTLVGSMD